MSQIPETLLSLKSFAFQSWNSHFKVVVPPPPATLCRRWRSSACCIRSERIGDSLFYTYILSFVALVTHCKVWFLIYVLHLSSFMPVLILSSQTAVSTCPHPAGSDWTSIKWGPWDLPTPNRSDTVLVQGAMLASPPSPSGSLLRPLLLF